ncbi:MAG: PHP domain-containing protein [Balneolales bacterium]
MSKADLHVHTSASDGIKSPEQVVRLAAEKGISTLAITDHDTISGYLAARDFAVEMGITLIPGVEITSDYKGKECHMLGYCFDINHSRLTEMLNGQKKIRILRAHKMVHNLNKLGFDLDFDDVMAESGTDSISRVHIAEVLVKKTYVANKKEAFDRFLADDGPAYHKSEYWSAADVISLIKEAGGVSVLAHPGLNYLYEDLRHFLNSGLDGIEYIHPSHNYELQKKYMDYANNFGLLLSGGSDFHGFKDHDISNFGTICIDTVLSEKLLTLSEQRKALSPIK